jgi:hypothetical protein
VGQLDTVEINPKYQIPNPMTRLTVTCLSLTASPPTSHSPCRRQPLTHRAAAKTLSPSTRCRHQSSPLSSASTSTLWPAIAHSSSPSTSPNPAIVNRTAASNHNSAAASTRRHRLPPLQVVASLVLALLSLPLHIINLVATIAL